MRPKQKINKPQTGAIKGLKNNTTEQFQALNKNRSSIILSRPTNMKIYTETS